MFKWRKGVDSLKVITAIGDEFLNNELRKNELYEVYGKDISYGEGIFEILEVNKDINQIILSNKITENKEFEILIEKLIKYKNIQIIVFLVEKNENIENFLNSKKIFKIYFLNNNGYNLFFENIRNKNKVEKEIENLKSLIISRRKNIKKIKINNKKYKKLNRKIENSVNFQKSIHKTETECQTIVISGVCGAGKTIISKILMNFIKNKGKAVYLLDFKSKKFNNYYINNYSNIKKYIENLKKSYEYLIIDIDHEDKNIKTVLYCSSKIVFLVEPNLSEIAKSKNILDVYINDFEINVDKIKILFNKSNKYKIAESILEEVFEDFEIIGEIKYDEKYNLIINKNKIENYNENEYEKVYKSIWKGEKWNY